MERGEGSQRGQAATQAFGVGKHELKLGKSFQQDNNCGFHTVRYDFKPASVDHSREAKLDVGETNEVTIKFPNVENKGPENTVFAGSKRPYQKECVLIYDHRTGEFTLEKLSCNIQVKRQRQEGTSKAQLAPKKPLKVPPKNSPNSRSKKKETSTSSAHSPAPPPDIKVERSPAPQPSPLATSEPSPPPTSTPTAPPRDGDSSDSYMSASDSDDHDDDSSSSSSGSSSSDEEAGRAPITKPRVESRADVDRGKPSPVQPSSNLFQLSEDLQLSESGSDSDSD